MTAGKLPRRADLHGLDLKEALAAAMRIKPPDKRPKPAPRRPAATRAEPRTIKGKRKAKGS
jgi:hypothetical protein